VQFIVCNILLRVKSVCVYVCVCVRERDSLSLRVGSLVAGHIWGAAHLHRVMPHQLHQDVGEQSLYISTATRLQGEYSS